MKKKIIKFCQLIDTGITYNPLTITVNNEYFENVTIDLKTKIFKGKGVIFSNCHFTNVTIINSKNLINLIGCDVKKNFTIDSPLSITQINASIFNSYKMTINSRELIVNSEINSDVINLRVGTLRVYNSLINNCTTRLVIDDKLYNAALISNSVINSELLNIESAYSINVQSSVITGIKVIKKDFKNEIVYT